MNKKKILRCFSVLLALGMLIAMLPASAYAADAWDGTTIVTSWYNTTDTSFTITTAAQLAGLAAIVNGTADGIEKDSFAGKTITLGADIDLGNQNWTPIGRRTALNDYDSFAGCFDGGGHSIQNMSITYDVKNQFAPNGSVLQLIGAVGLFGSVAGTEENRAVIKNIVLDGDVTITSVGPNNNPSQSRGYAGLVGKANFVNVTNCIVSVDIQDNSSVSMEQGIGGIVGYGEHITIVECTNHGNIYSGKGQYVGGLGGWFVTAPFVIHDSYNTGSISAANVVGGLFGQIAFGTSSSEICDCMNTGVVTTTGTGKVIGAVIGKATGTLSTANDIYYLEGTCQKAVAGGTVTTTAISQGDISLDGYVDETDVTYLIGHVIGTDVLNSILASISNVNNDGFIDENDVTCLIQIVLDMN